ncbi:thioredoxin domain-containing protein [Clostridium tetani]|uniref:thioredoxin domain-containing protein n=1 Tax=Clostridium tetani TaxID=1513 RepID=UPI00100B6402|nr:thioredoxin domain-containing protein [Clostridium tetani]RXI38586.1 thioredoxin domain-containing protein [Clostridium tetani]
MTNLNRAPNRLAQEKSPYLLQHANNPVDWYPWGDEAFEKAKEEDKPIFLSIGYSTCHWCHVMERESFEDKEVAKLLNDNFISIKVDREERPDIDNIYMTFCQAVTGSGGWPLTIIMTPDKKPFFAGTYFPKEDRYGVSGFMHILKEMSNQWKGNRERIVNSSEKLLKDMTQYISVSQKEELNKEVIKECFEVLKESYDPIHGGFYDAPKFPTSHKLMFLLRYHRLYKDEEALNIVEKTLKSMYKGGIFDHIGYGFSRYSTDDKWLVPHFEKMLYDNAMLIIAYAEMYQITKEELYKEIIEKTIAYVIRDMKDKKGAFYSAEDADSEGVEGKFYVWTLEEIEDILGKEDAKLFSKYYGITDRGNFEGENIPNLIDTPLEDLEPDVKDKLEVIWETLFINREKRIHPHKDTKILTSWNGLMIAALAYSGRVLKRKDYIESAEEAVKFIMENLIDENGRIFVRYRDGERAHKGHLEDYSFLIWALIELYQSTFKTEYIEEALKINSDMIELFWDEENHGFFHTGKDGEELILKLKESYDSAIPSGNSVAMYNMVRLSRVTGDSKLDEIIQQNLNYFSGRIKRTLESHTFFLISYMHYVLESEEVVIAKGEDEDIFKGMIKVINEKYHPFSMNIVKDEKVEKLMPELKEKNNIQNKTTVYICKNFACGNPITSLEDLIDKY